MVGAGANTTEHNHATKAARGLWIGGNQVGIDIALVKGRRVKEGGGTMIGDGGIWRPLSYPHAKGSWRADRGMKEGD